VRSVVVVNVKCMQVGPGAQWQRHVQPPTRQGTAYSILCPRQCLDRSDALLWPATHAMPRQPAWFFLPHGSCHSNTLQKTTGPQAIGCALTTAWMVLQQCTWLRLNQGRLILNSSRRCSVLKGSSHAPPSVSAFALSKGSGLCIHRLERHGGPGHERSSRRRRVSAPTSKAYDVVQHADTV
jgi:hypothetical protein